MALPGVGRNLQDRYEVSVVSRMDFPEWRIFRGATFRRGDAAYRRWEDGGRGLYASNGAVLTVFTRSTVAGALPDLFVMAMVARFDGYAPGYSASLGTERNCLTWVVLKAHTKNTAGEVTLQSADPRDPPRINFRQWVDGGADDLRAVADGVRFVRRLNDRLRAYGNVVTEVVPGPGGRDRRGDRGPRPAQRLGPSRLRHVRDWAGRPRRRRRQPVPRPRHAGLRIVDASVFPTIPGFFIASAVYMVGEKAADVILADAGGGSRRVPAGQREN